VDKGKKMTVEKRKKSTYVCGSENHYWGCWKKKRGLGVEEKKPGPGNAHGGGVKSKRLKKKEACLSTP